MSDQRTGIREAFVALVSVFSVLGAPTLAADGSGANLPESFFTERVAPILEEHCVECHGTEKQKNGLRLDRVEGVVRGGDSGEPLLKAGDPEGSYLIRRVLSNDPKDRMPPKGDRVSEGEIEILRRWIAAGGRMPGAERIASEQRIKTDHWSFQPVRRVENGKQGAAVIDALIELGLAD
jgi:hypothetical protein